MTVLVPHDPTCARPGLGHSDAAKRLSDIYRLHKTAGGRAAWGRWIAVALADGRSDHVLYDSKTDAVRHQRHNEQWFCFTCIGPADLSPCDAEEWLAIHRMYYDAGLRLPDPSDRRGGRDVIVRATAEDQRSLVASIASKGRLRPANLIPFGGN